MKPELVPRTALGWCNAHRIQIVVMSGVYYLLCVRSTNFFPPVIYSVGVRSPRSHALKEIDIFQSVIKIIAVIAVLL